MNFRDATSALLSEGFGISEIARAVSASEASVRAARQPEDAEGYRKPPKEWEAPLAALAMGRVARLSKLAFDWHPSTFGLFDLPPMWDARTMHAPSRPSRAPVPKELQTRRRKK